MSALSFAEACASVRHQLQAVPPPAQTEVVSLLETNLRVLAEDIVADRDSPALTRSVRDGYAVRATDLPGRFRILGEVRAGEIFEGAVGPQEAVEIMTGAPVPEGADAIVMIEHTRRDGSFMVTDREHRSGDNINPRAAEYHQGDMLLGAGTRIGFAEAAVLATVGKSQVRVYPKPRVAVLATGDEVLAVDRTPLPHQIRNSNAYSLAIQLQQAGAMPVLLPIAPDQYDETRSLIERGLEYDLLLLSGGVSAGKYDIVEKVLSDLHAEFFFDRVAIQPGQPVVFGRVGSKFFFGLPGNPASTMVTFLLFAKPALARLGGVADPLLPLLYARLTKPFRHKTGLTRFLPAHLDSHGQEITPLPWQGSGDVAAQARANVFLVADAERESWESGEMIRVLVK